MLRSLLICLLACSTPATAQIIRGTVTDASTGSPIQAVDVSLVGSSGRSLYRVLSDEDGNFVLIVPAGRPVQIRIERIGYSGLTSDGLTVPPAEQLEIDVRMSPNAIDVEGVNVVARRPVDARLEPFYKRAAMYKKFGIGHIWTRADLASFPTVLTSHLLTRVPHRPEGACRGSMAFIDNIRVDPEDIDMLVTPGELEGVEVYRDTEIPPDLVMIARGPDISNPTPDGIGVETIPCLAMFFWRKPYGEGGTRLTWSRLFTTVGFLGIVFVLDYHFWPR